MFEKTLEFYKSMPLEELTKHLKDIGIKFLSKQNEVVVERYDIECFTGYHLDNIDLSSRGSYKETFTYENKFNYGNIFKQNQNKYSIFENSDEYKEAS